MTVEPRHAATLLVVDHTGPAPRLLMGHRRATARFMPGAAVFPGGGVDHADHIAPAATPLDPLTRAHLCRAASPSLAHALASAAARELHEETGLCLGQPPTLAPLRYLCRAVTPPDRPIRFDARFLVVDAAHLAPAATPLLQDGELETLAWHTLPETAELHLRTPTRVALALLAAYLSGATPWPTQPESPLPVLLNGRDCTYE
jgi:8-oxo-dGTP pyrophosphatase MutT (NUDIX family)